MLRIRQRKGLSADKDTFTARLETARKAAGELNSLVQREGIRLLSRVELEAENDDNTLAEEVYRSVTHGELSADLDAINSLNITLLRRQSTSLNATIGAVN